MQHEDPKDWKAPKTFEEYLTRFPDWHERWLHKRYPRHTNSDFEDISQHLLVESIRKQRVEKYDTTKQGLKDSPALFFNWMSMCFRNDLVQFLRRKTTGADSANYNTFAIDFNPDPESTDTAASENYIDHLSNKSRIYHFKTEQEGRRAYVLTRLSEFRNFLEKHRPDLLPSLDRLAEGTATRREQLKLWAVRMTFEKGGIPHRHKSRQKKNDPHLSEERKVEREQKRLAAEERKRKSEERHLMIVGTALSNPLLTLEQVAELCGTTRKIVDYAVEKFGLRELRLSLRRTIQETRKNQSDIEKHREYHRNYWATHPEYREVAKKRNAKWHKKHPDKIKEYQRRYLARKRKSETA